MQISKIPANDLGRGFRLYGDEYEQKALEVLRSGWYVLGREVSAFETEFAASVGAGHCVGLASGLDALWIAFRLLGIGSGDEVIVCTNSYIACVMGITINGATPVFAEPDEYDNLDAEKIERAITPRTKAILAVHLYGQTCDMDRIMAIAKKHCLKVVEDCAQANATLYKGKYAGTFGDIGCFSFYPTKNLGAFGDGGAIVTDDAVLAENCRMIRNYGSRVKYHNEVVGANSRLDEMQAGLLRVRLSHLDELTKERQRIAERYYAGIKEDYLALPRIRPGVTPTWHQYVIHTPYRDELKKYLAENGIGSEIHYPIPPHLSKAYQYLGYHEGDFPIAEKYAAEVLSLPMFNGMTPEETEQVIEVINRFVPAGKENA